MQGIPQHELCATAGRKRWSGHHTASCGFESFSNKCGVGGVRQGAHVKTQETVFVAAFDVTHLLENACCTGGDAAACMSLAPPWGCLRPAAQASA